MVTIADKINAMLAERGLLKRDLARALGVSPQTATDICKGRSAVTLRHLRSLVRLFEISADYWIDETRLEPTTVDRTTAGLDARLDRLRRAGLLDVDDPELLVRRLGDFVRAHRQEFLRHSGAPDADLRRLLRLDLDGGAVEDGRAVAGGDAAALN